jgi:hypothetical protein
MKKEKKVYFEGTAPVYGRAARRLERLIANPRKATPEEKEKIFNAPKELNLVRCDLW